MPHAAGARVALKPPASLGDFSLLGVEQRERGDTTVIRARLALYRLGAHQTPPLAVDVGGVTVTARAGDRDGDADTRRGPRAVAGGHSRAGRAHCAGRAGSSRSAALRSWRSWSADRPRCAIVAAATNARSAHARALDGLAHDARRRRAAVPVVVAYADDLRALRRRARRLRRARAHDGRARRVPGAPSAAGLDTRRAHRLAVAGRPRQIRARRLRRRQRSPRAVVRARRRRRHHGGGGATASRRETSSARLAVS